MCGSDALPFRLTLNFGASPQQIGRSPNRENSLAGRPKAFRTSGGIAADFLGKAHYLSLFSHVTLHAALWVGTGDLLREFGLRLDRGIVTFKAVDVIGVLVIHLHLLTVLFDHRQFFAFI